MSAILYTELVYSAAAAALLALMFMRNRLTARFAPARRRRQRSDEPRHPIHR